MTTFDKWYQKPETKALLASAKKNAWDQFTKQFPNADKDQFFVQTSVDEKYKITAEVFFRESAEYSSSVFGSDRKYWSQKKKTALGLIGVEDFPFQLSPLKTETKLPIPAVEFTEPAPSVSKIIIIIIIMVYLQYSNKREALTTVNAIYTNKNKTI